MLKCRCAMCGGKRANSNRCKLYRYVPCDEMIPRGKDKIAARRRLRRSILKLDSSKRAL